MITCPWCEQQYSEFGFRAHECTEAPPVEGPNVAEVIALRALSMTAMRIVLKGDTLYGTFFPGRSPRRRDHDRPSADTSPVPRRARRTPKETEQ